MNLRALRIFRQVVVTGSLAEASRELNISASAASRLLSLLEAELKLTLFTRGGRRLELTEEGDSFYRQTEPVLRGLDEMEQLAREIGSQRRETLHLVTAAPLAIGLASPALALMRQDGKAPDCTISVCSRFELESRVASRAYNLGIISLPIENSILDLEVQPFLEARLCVAMRADHPLAEKAEIDPAELAAEPSVVLRKGQRWRERFDDLFDKIGLTPKIALETTASPVVKSLVMDGLGVTVADAISLRLHPGDTLVLKPLKPETWVTYTLIHPSGPRPRHGAELIAAMCRFARQQMQTDPRLTGLMRVIGD